MLRQWNSCYILGDGWRHSLQPAWGSVRELSAQSGILNCILICCIWRKWRWKLLNRVWLFATLWNSLGQNTGVGSLSLLQGVFPIQEVNQVLLHCRWILYLSYQGSQSLSTSFEPESNQQPKDDRSLSPLQSFALPAELSKGADIWRVSVNSF